MTTTATAESQLAALEATLRTYQVPLAVAFSGGVDSSVVALAATRALGHEAVACVAAKSESNTDEDIALCREIAAAHGLRLEVIEYSELAIPNYAENPVNRCYFCKSELYTRLGGLADAHGWNTVLDGSNADDAGDYRPGMKAVGERGVRSPLREAGIDKEGVRAIAAHLGLANHDRPSSPCLSSRVPYGETITREKLQQVAGAEAFLRGLGLRELRCRHHDKVARIEVPDDQMAAVMEHRSAIVAELRRLGFTWVALDLAGFRSGSLNAVLDSATLARGRTAPLDHSPQKTKI